MCAAGFERGVTRNYAEAARWYRKAADQGNATDFSKCRIATG